jgi:hypothetical protein
MNQTQKLGTDYDYIPENKLEGISSGVRSYWTNFEKTDSPKVSPVISQTPVAGYWEFKTNIGWEDLNLLWDEKRLKRFLHQMWEFYRHRKVS